MGKGYKTEELWVEHDGQRIFGMLYVPEGLAVPVPAVICSHFFGGTHLESGEYARAMAEAGYVAYAFDFCGGSPRSSSTGKTTEASILTEAADLSAVLDAIRALDIVDKTNVYLLGQSQGGAVSTIVAAERPQDVAGLALLYPALVIHDDAVRRFGTADNVPDTYIQFFKLGRIYAVDAIAYDFFEHMAAYTGPVILFHGDADSLVPLSYSERAAATYTDVDFEVIHGADHGFYGADQAHVCERVAAFIAAHAR